MGLQKDPKGQKKVKKIFFRYIFANYFIQRSLIFFVKEQFEAIAIV